MDTISHQELKEALKTRYTRPYWLLTTEVKDQTGFEWKTSADAVAFGLYASRGQEVHVFECKATRADWLSELRNPEKAETWVGVADKFWIVAPKGVVQVRELPIRWGLITVSRGKKNLWTLRAAKQAGQFTSDSDGTLPKSFCASLIVKAYKQLEKYEKDTIPRDEIASRLRAEFQKGRKIGEQSITGERMRDEYARFKRVVNDFEEASGIKLKYYSRGEDLGNRVRVVEKLENLGVFSKSFSSDRFLGTLKEHIQDIEKALQKLRQTNKDLLEKGKLPE